MTEVRVFYVLLMRGTGGILNDGFEYWSDRLPAVGDEIEVVPPADFRPHSGERSSVVRAVVTGVEPGKHSPVRAREL